MHNRVAACPLEQGGNALVEGLIMSRSSPPVRLEIN